MTTHFGTGYSDSGSSREAGQAAAKAAIAQMGGGSADMVFAFASTNYDFSEMLAGIRSETGDAPVVGSSTAGQFTEGQLGRESVVVAAIKSDSIKLHAALGRGLRADQGVAVKEAFESFSSIQRKAREDGMQHSTLFLMTDGLAGNGEALVEAVHGASGMLAQVVGGAAADAAQFVRTDVFFNDRVHTDAMVVVAAFSKSPIGLGVRHGLSSACDSMIVTQASGTTLVEIDNKPAIEAYAKFAKSIGAPFEGDNREAFMMTHEIGMLTPSGEYKVRAPLKANDDGSIAMAAEVPIGASITIMKGTKDALVAAAEGAAQSALANLGGGSPAGILVFDCICRRIFLGDDYGRQVEAYRSVVGEVPVAGWETYGEIAMTPSQEAGWHNSTTVLAVLPH